MQELMPHFLFILLIFSTLNELAKLELVIGGEK